MQLLRFAQHDSAIFSQRGKAATKLVGPNGVRPRGERRSPLRGKQNLRSTKRSRRIVVQLLSFELAVRSAAILSRVRCGLEARAPDDRARDQGITTVPIFLLTSARTCGSLHACSMGRSRPVG